MDTTLRDRIDASFGDGPSQPEFEETIMEGRRVIRNRRIILGAGALAVLTAIGVGTAVLPDSTRAADIAKDPTDSPSENPADAASAALTAAIPVDDAWRSGCDSAGKPTCDELMGRIGAVRYLSDGTLVRSADDVVILQRTDDPLAMRGEKTVALEAELDGDLRWWMLSWTPDRVGVWVADPAGAGSDFSFWSENTRGRAVVPGEPALTQLPGR